MNTREKELILLYLIIDLILLNLSLVGVILFKVDYNLNHILEHNEYFVMFNLSWIIAYFIFRKRNLFLRDGFTNRIKRQIIRSFLYLSIASIIILAMKFENVSRMIFFGSNVLFFVSKFIFFFFLYRFMAYRRRNGRHVHKVLIIGDNVISDDISKYFDNNSDMGYHVIGYLDDTNKRESNLPKLGSLNDFQRIFEDVNFKEVIITLPLNKEWEIKNIIKLSEYNGVRIKLIPDYFHTLKRDTDTQVVGGIPFINLRGIPLDGLGLRILKRAFDIVFSLFVLIIFSPVYLIIALAIKVDSKGPVFYKPIRMGKAGKEFKVLKFRSMKVSNDAENGNRSTVIGDSRITKVGAFLRKSNLDELPQFINVLFGNMSVVGPRPHRLNLNRDLQNKMSRYMVRHYVKPGLTGWAQVNGWRGPTETKIQYSGRTLHDLWYIENWTFTLDIYIVLLTVFGSKVKKNAF